MDKVVDHLLVFKGNGVIKDFPGNYTQYREWQALQPRDSKESGNPRDTKYTSCTRKTSNTSNSRNASYSKKKMSYKEKTEFERLEKEIAALEEEQRQIEEALCSGTLSIDELTENSKRLPLLKDELDEKSMRWLELSEIEK